MNFDFEKCMISGKDYQLLDPYMYIYKRYENPCIANFLH